MIFAAGLWSRSYSRQLRTAALNVCAVHTSGHSCTTACVLRCVWPFVTLWTEAHEALLSMEFSSQEYSQVSTSFSRGSSQPRDWTLVSCNSCIAGGFFTTGTTWEAQCSVNRAFICVSDGPAGAWVHFETLLSSEEFPSKWRNYRRLEESDHKIGPNSDIWL